MEKTGLSEAYFQLNAIFWWLNMFVLTGCMASQGFPQKNKNVRSKKIKARNHTQYFLLLHPKQKSNICQRKLIKIWNFTRSWMEKSTFRRDDLYSREWVLCFNMDFHTCIKLFWQKKSQKSMLSHLNLPCPLLLQIEKNGFEMLIKPWFNSPQGTFFLNMRLDFKRLVKKL